MSFNWLEDIYRPDSAGTRRVFTIGPYFELDGRVHGHIAIDLQTDIHLNYVFNDIEMWFPKEYLNHSKEGGVKTKDSSKSAFSFCL